MAGRMDTVIFKHSSSMPCNVPLVLLSIDLTSNFACGWEVLPLVELQCRHSNWKLVIRSVLPFDFGMMWPTVRYSI